MTEETIKTILGPIAKMYEAGFGTGHAMDLRPTQVTLPGDETVHNILRKATLAGSVIGALEPIPITMCGIRLEEWGVRPYKVIGVPYDSGPTTCDACANLAVWRVVAT